MFVKKIKPKTRPRPKHKPKHTSVPIYDIRDIRDGVKKIARQINKPSQRDEHNTVLICLLNGSFMFFSDLCKLVNITCQIDFMKVKSYNGQEQGDVEIILDTQLDLKDKRVFVIDDFYDSGKTMNKVLDMLAERGPKSLNGAVLFKRHEAKAGNHRVLHGIWVRDKVWLYGYGMDKENQYGRNSREVYAI